MASLLDLRVSRVGPAVEDNLVQLVDMVKQMGRKGGNLTESQNRKMVGYLGNLDEMRGQIVIMVQRYEDDGSVLQRLLELLDMIDDAKLLALLAEGGIESVYEDDSKVLKRLLELLDRIDDVKDLALTSEESKDKDAPLVDDREIAERYDTPFNPLMVSTLNILDVSGLFASKIIPLDDDDEEDEEEEEEEEEDGDAFWDHADDPAMVAPESEPQEVSAINLSMSNLFLPSLFESCDNLPTTPLPPPPPHAAAATLYSTSCSSPLASSSSSLLAPVHSELSLSDANLPSLFDSSRANIPIPPPPPSTKGKGKGKDVKGKGKAVREQRWKGKEKAHVTFANLSSSESERRSGSESGSESGDEKSEKEDSEGEEGAQMPKPTAVRLAWRRTTPAGMSRPSFGSSSSSSSSSTTTTTTTATTPARPNLNRSDSSSGSAESESESESESEISDTGSSSASSGSDGAAGRAAAAKSRKAARAIRKRRGMCDAPVLCRICYDEYDRWELVHQLGCEHTYCRDCLRDYLATHITEGAVLDLTCPFPECQTEFPPTDIKFLCTSEIYAKFERFTLLAALRADPNARWCPNPYCNNGIKHNPETMPWVYCNACKFEFCFHCMAERHDGVACGQEALEYLKKKHESEQAATNQFNEWAELMKALVKPCPGCKAFIEKNDGCNHMTCTNPTCRIQFCWLCLTLYDPDHFMDDINYPDCYDKQYWTPPEILLQTANLARQEAVIPRARRFANIAKKVGIYMGVGVAVVTLGVPAAVIGGPVYGCFKLHKRLKARRRANRPRQRQDGSGETWTPPTQERIRQAQAEARRLYQLEHGG